MTNQYRLTAHFVFLVVLATLLSGCSLLPARPETEAKPVDPAFLTKPLPGSIWKSIDGGKTFEPKVYVDEKSKITSANILALSFVENDPNFPDPPSAPKIYAGTVESGIFSSENGGESWVPIPFPPQKIYSFLVDRSDSKRLFATGVIADRGKVFRSTDTGETWQEMYTEPGQKTSVVALAQHFRDTNVIFAGTSGGTVVKSTDRGDTWKNVGQPIDGPVTKIVFDAVRPKTLYALSFEKKLWYSMNGGETWIDWEVAKRDEQSACRERNKKSSSKTDPCAKIVDAARTMPGGIVSVVADPRVSGRLLVGTKKGLFESKDYGKYWSEINIIESARSFPLRAIAISPADTNEIVFVAGRALYKSTNGGTTWSVMQLKVNRDVSVLEYDPLHASDIYFGLREY